MELKCVRGSQSLFFCRHLFTLNHQYKVLRQTKRSLGSNEVVLHTDFAENYSCKLSSETQSLHFDASRNQVTLHNVVAYTSTGISTYSTLSDSQSGVALVPCGHARFWTACADTVAAIGNGCPLCRSRIDRCCASTTDCELWHCDTNVTVVVFTRICVHVITY